jgi:hypothetical protein
MITKNSVESKGNLVTSILCEEFGYNLVYKSIEHRHCYENIKKQNPCLISKVFNELSYKWQEGKAKEYLESLEEWLQYCLICHLAEDYINDKYLATFDELVEV